jgi:hypothetical protein
VTATSADRREQEWDTASESWFARLLAAAPRLGPKQREALRKLLDLSGDRDD